LRPYKIEENGRPWMMKYMPWWEATYWDILTQKRY